MIINYLSLIFLNFLFLGLLLVSLKTRNITVMILSALVYLAHGLGSLLFYVNRHQFYNHPGTFTVNNFNFFLPELLFLYKYPILFLILILFFSMATQARFLTRPFGSLKIYKISHLQNKKPWLICALFVIFFSAIISINAFMYQNSIGIVGLNQKELPYKLTGLLYYLRYFLPPIGIFIFGLFLRKHFYYWILSFLLAILLGLSSASRSLSILCLGPLLIYSIFEKRFFRSYLFLILMILTFQLITYSRDHSYLNRNSSTRFLIENINHSLSKFNAINLVDQAQQSLFNITYRLGGPHDLVLVNESNINTAQAFQSVLSLISGEGLSGPDIVHALFRTELDKNFAFGATLSPLAMLNIALKHSPALSFTLLFYYIIILLSMDFFLTLTLRGDAERIISLFPRFLTVYFFLSLEFKKIFWLFLLVLLYFLLNKYFVSIAKRIFPKVITNR